MLDYGALSKSPFFEPVVSPEEFSRRGDCCLFVFVGEHFWRKPLEEFHGPHTIMNTIKPKDIYMTSAFDLVLDVISQKGLRIIPLSFCNLTIEEMQRLLEQRELKRKVIKVTHAPDPDVAEVIRKAEEQLTKSELIKKWISLMDN